MSEPQQSSRRDEDTPRRSTLTVSGADSYEQRPDARIGLVPVKRGSSDDSKVYMH